MPKLIYGDGVRRNPRAFICGERPGREEHREGRGFVGPAGQELWSRLRYVSTLTRDECWVTNLVKTMSTAPPSFREIARDAHILRDELRTIRPRLIVTVGYHAARWFLPQFADVRGDYFHGLAFSTPRCKGAIVIPVVHSAAALRQPDIYQEQLTNDLRAVAGFLEAADVRHQRHDRSDLRARYGNAGRPIRTPHTAAPAHVFPCGLATTLQEAASGETLGLDSEGSTHAPECLTLATSDRQAALVEVFQRGRRTPALQYVQQALDRARVVAIHHAKHDWQVLHKLRLTLRAGIVRDTMLEAYLLGLPQSLKVLAFRTCGLAMSEYDDIVGPLDESLVHSTLEAAYANWSELFQRARDAQTRASRIERDRRAAKISRSTHGVTHAGRGTSQTPRQKKVTEAPPPKVVRDRKTGQAIARRSLASVRGILDKAAEKTRRQRWESSTFSGQLTLPPAPTWKDAPRAIREPYALADSVGHRSVHAYMAPLIKEAGLTRISRIDHSILPFLVRSELVGVKVDGPYLEQLSATFKADFASTCAQLEALAGYAINPLAAEDVSDAMFEDWGVTPTRATKTGFFTTQDKYLKARKHEHEGVPLIIEARQINKMVGTYTERLPKLLRRGRYHPNWKYTRTASGRAAEEIILLIPKHSARGKLIRKAFVADDGCVLVSVDLSQIEMRVMAHESQDPIFLKNYRTGVDMHASTAHHLLGAPKDRDQQDESLHRLPAKTLNFGVLMGMTEYGLADQLQEQGQSQWIVDYEHQAARQINNQRFTYESWDARQHAIAVLTDEIRNQGFKSTREFLREWFKVYKGVRVWMELKKREARKTGYVRDLYGRRIAVSGIWSSDDRIAAEFGRKAHAIPIQSGAQGTAKRWIARIWRDTIVPRLATGQYCEPAWWIHDDVTLCVDRRAAKAVAREMLACVPQDLCVPATADSKTGPNWAELH